MAPAVRKRGLFGPPLWLLPNVLSLDAPLIAVLWQAFIAQYSSSQVRPAGRLVLGLTVWAIYIADRLLDTRDPAHPCDTERHRFYRRHHRAAILLLVAILAADLFVTVVYVRPTVFHTGLLPLAGVALYLTLFHASERFRLPKEFVVALLFTVGTFVVAWSTTPGPISTLLWPALSFFALCFANLVAIEMWESHELPGRDPRKAHFAIGWLGRSYLFWVSCLILASLAQGQSPWYRAVALSAAAMAVLYWIDIRLPIELRRTLVDAAMLSPALFLR